MHRHPDLSRTVEVDAPYVDIAGTVAALADSALDAFDHVAERCADRRHGETPGSFVVSGRQSVPPGPDGPLAAWSGAEPSVSSDAMGPRMQLADSCR